MEFELDQQLIPDWRSHPSAEVYFSSESVHDELEDTLDISAFPGADWMYLAELVSLKFQNIVM